MITTTTGTPRTASSRTGGLPVFATDREREFRRARRHTFLVKTLRRLLPVITLAILSGYLVTGYASSNFFDGLANLSIPRITTENLTMVDPRYEGFTEDGGSYRVTAKTARQDFAKPDIINLETITGDMLDAERKQTRFAAARGVFNSKNNVLNLSGGIRIVDDAGTSADLKSAVVHIRRSLIVSQEPVRVATAAGSVEAAQLQIKQKTKEVTFVGDVRTLLQPARKPASPEAPAAPAAKSAVGPLSGASDSPVTIQSQSLYLADLEQRAVFKGGVRAEQDGQELQTQSLEVTYARAEADGGTAKLAASPLGPAGSGTRVTRILAPGSILMTRPTGEQVTSQSADFDVAAGKGVLQGSVVMTSGADRRVSADRADLDQIADTALLTGSVVVNQGANELRGERLFIDRTAGITRMTTPTPKGRIAARLVRDAAGATPTLADAAAAATAITPAKAAAALPAATGPAGALTSAGAFKTDPKAPIDITADSLDVVDADKAATFRGAVQAKQGTFTLTTSELVAHYSGSGGLADATRPPPATAAPEAGATPGQAEAAEAGTKLERIEARGKVVVSSEGGQSATGDHADFNADANTVLLTGDVVLTQGKSIVRGSRLKIDMTTGEAVIETAPENVGAAWAATTQEPGGAPVAVPQSATAARAASRPSAVFFPNQLKPGAVPGKPTQAAVAPAATATATTPAASAERGPTAPSAASSWDATTEPARVELPEDDDADDAN